MTLQPTRSLPAFPAPLSPGDRIALVAPSSPFKVEEFTLASQRLEEAGYVPAPAEHLMVRNGYLAGTEAQRVQDLIRAFSDDKISAVFCVRGGYGSGRLLPWLPFSTIESSPKIFLGYSDITFLHLAFQTQMNWITFHGPNFIEANESADKLQEILSPLCGDHSFCWEFSDRQVIRHGTASGKLYGGNLTCLVHLIGTPYFPDLKDSLLFIEECCEALYRLDRLLTHLRLADHMQHLGGLLLGRFHECGNDSGNIVEMVSERTESFHFPVVTDLPFGHGGRNDVIPLGAFFSLNTYDKNLRILDHPLH
jgi:muramoyltetrapeptide carboxypeptidase